MRNLEERDVVLRDAAAGLGLFFSPRNTFTSVHTVNIDSLYF